MPSLQLASNSRLYGGAMYLPIILILPDLDIQLTLEFLNIKEMFCSLCNNNLNLDFLMSQKTLDNQRNLDTSHTSSRSHQNMSLPILILVNLHLLRLAQLRHQITLTDTYPRRTRCTHRRRMM